MDKQPFDRDRELPNWALVRKRAVAFSELSNIAGVSDFDGASINFSILERKHQPRAIRADGR